ncbi:MAG: sensor domain-containing diguanylate cyclase [Marinisporobacter sp.]|jgi:diguanylate cyclase (GGDEF)-like protein|nr:sensor domain-containing diguanylate cyclase [Marinisporobacter sp.]
MKIKIKENIDIKAMSRSFMTIFLVFSISAGITFYGIHITFKNNIKKEIQLKSEIVNANVSQIFEINKVMVQQMENNEDIRQYLKEVKDRKNITTHPLYPRVYKTIKNIRNTSEFLFMTWIGNENANFYMDDAGYIPGERYNIIDRPWYPSAVQSKGVVFTDPYRDVGTGNLVISSIKAIKEKEKLIGFVAVDLSLRCVPKMMKKYVVGKNGVNFIVSRDGMIIYSGDLAIKNKSMYKEPLFSGIEQGLVKGYKGFDEIQYKEKDYFIYYEPIDQTNWSIVQLIDEDEMMKQLHELMEKIIMTYVIGTIFLLGVIFINIIERKNIEEELKIQARTDPLTGANNRSYFMKKAHETFEYVKEEKKLYAVLLMDIDYFKKVNDTYGHHIGDEVLKNVVRSSLDHLRESDIFGRIGGEEFAIVLINTGQKSAFHIAERLRKKLSRLCIDTKKGQIHITVSIGISYLKESDENFEQILERADEGLYEAKRSGRNRVQVK